MSEETGEGMPDFIIEHADRLARHFARVGSLIDTYGFLANYLERMTGQKPNSNPKLPEVDDILRSAVVLLHATLEDCIRSIALKHLPRKAPDLLRNIPLAGMNDIHSSKYSLADFSSHRGKQVDTVIEESIEEWLKKRSFNNCTDLATILTQIGIKPADCEESFPTLDEMIERRHRIVHNADQLPKTNDPSAPELAPIDRATVEKWKAAVLDFMNSVLYRLQFVSKE